MVEYVRTFVDEEFAWVVGLAYWYAFVSVFALENLGAAGLSSYWGLSQTFQTLAFYVFAPLIIFILNMFGVFVSLNKVCDGKDEMLIIIKWYGLVETVGGALKCALILGVCVLLYTIASQGNFLLKFGPIFLVQF